MKHLSFEQWFSDARPAKPATPRTVAELNRWFEKNFDCREGLPRAWMEIDAAGEIMPPDAGDPEMQQSGSQRLMYRVYAVGAEKVNGESAEGRLVEWMFRELERYADGTRPKLYWRRHLALTEETRTIYKSEPVIRAEMVEDGLATPTAEMEIDWLTNCWRVVERRIPMQKLSVRLGIVGAEMHNYTPEGVLCQEI